MTINYNFTPSSDVALFDAAMPSTFFRVQSYILKRMQIPGWKINRVDICRQLNLSMSTVKRAFRWLRDHGYATWDSATWTFYPAPNVSNAAPFKPVEGSLLTPPTPVTFDPPYIEVSLEKEKQQPEPVRNLVTEQEPVVVSIESENLVYPEQLNKPEFKKAAKHKLKKLKQPELSQEVLFALAYSLAQGTVKNPIGYLSSIVTACNEGRFTPVNRAGATKLDARRIDATQEQLEAYRTINRTEPKKAKGFIAGLKGALGGAR